MGLFTRWRSMINNGTGTGGSTPSNVVLFEDWNGGESVTIDTSISPPSDTSAPIITVNPNGGTFASSLNITLTANETSTIYYTLDGTTPTTSSTIYSNSFTITDTTTLKFFGKDSAGNISLIQSVTFTKDTTAPSDTTAPVLTITPATTFTDSQNVTMSTNETADIWYTTDGSDPMSSGTRVKYSIALNLTATTTVKAYAVDTAGNASAVQAVTYTKQVVDPNLMVSDTFDKSDQTGLGTTQTGQLWGTAGGLDISGNVAKHNVLSTSLASDVIDIGVSDNFEVTCDINSNSGTNVWGITVRAQSDGLNGRTFGGLVNGATLDKVGIYGVTSTHKTGVPINGVHTFKVRVQGSKIQGYVDDVLQVDYTETDNTKLTNTRVGLWCYNNTTNTFNNFKVTKIV